MHYKAMLAMQDHIKRAASQELSVEFTDEEALSWLKKLDLMKIHEVGILGLRNTDSEACLRLSYQEIAHQLSEFEVFNLNVKP